MLSLMVELTKCTLTHLLHNFSACCMLVCVLSMLSYWYSMTVCHVTFLSTTSNTYPQYVIHATKVVGKSQSLSARYTKSTFHYACTKSTDQYQSLCNSNIHNKLYILLVFQKTALISEVANTIVTEALSLWLVCILKS